MKIIKTFEGFFDRFKKPKENIAFDEDLWDGKEKKIESENFYAEIGKKSGRNGTLVGSDTDYTVYIRKNWGNVAIPIGSVKKSPNGNLILTTWYAHNDVHADGSGRNGNLKKYKASSVESALNFLEKKRSEKIQSEEDIDNQYDEEIG